MPDSDRRGGSDSSPAKTGRQSRWLILWVLASLIAITGAFIAGMFVRSPWDGASANAAANPIVLANVGSYDFTSDRPILPGTIALGRLTDISIPATEGSAVVTRVYGRSGARIRSGDPLIEVSGRPLLALDIPFPLYRTITPGDQGADVLAIQRALKTLGLYPSGAVDGVYGPATSRAVASLYTNSGLAPPSPSLSLTLAARAAEKALSNTSSSPGSKRYVELVNARDEAAAAAAVPLPMSEVAAVAGGDLTVVKTPAVGTILDGGTNSSIQLRGGTPSATGRVAVTDKDAFGPGVEVVVRNESGDRLTGVVSGQSEFRNDDPAGYDVRVRLTAKASGWREGEAISITPALAPSRENGLGLPLSAIREDAEGIYVWVSSPRGELERTPVTLGAERGGIVRIVSGSVNEGDKVVVAGR